MRKGSAGGRLGAAAVWTLLVGCLLAVHSVPLRAGYYTYSWGSNAYGQLGDPAAGTVQLSPYFISALGDSYLTVHAGNGFSVALLSEGMVKAWGKNNQGQLGNGTMGTDMPYPVAVSGLTDVKALSAGDSHVLAVRFDRTVWTWGANTSGQLGDGTSASRDVPSMVGQLAGVVAVAAGGGHSLALRDDGTVWAWGGNSQGQLGIGDTRNRWTPVQVPGLTGVAVIACGKDHSLALKCDGTVWAWGSNDKGQLGIGSSASYVASPAQVRTLGADEASKAMALAAGARHSVAVAADGTAWAWGWNAYGQLGNGGTSDASSPVRCKLADGGETVAVAGGSGHTLAIRTNTGEANFNIVWAWGRNREGQLGVSSLQDKIDPVSTGLGQVSSLSAGYNHSLAQASMVATAPAILFPPLGGDVLRGSSATLTVGASGKPRLQFQWYRGPQYCTTDPVAGAVYPTFVTPPVTAEVSYWVKIQCEDGYVCSTAAVLTPVEGPTITRQPNSPAGCFGQSVSISLSASGTRPLKYHWYEGERGDTSKPVGSNSEAYSLVIEETKKFWVRVTNDYGQADSETATVTLRQAVGILSHPSPTSVYAGESASLVVVPVGDGVTGQWYRGASGDTSAPVGTGLTLNTGPLTASADFWARLTNPCGVADSRAARVTVLTGGPVAPGDVRAVNTSSTAVLLTWFSGNAATAQIEIQRKTGAGGTFAHVATVRGDLTSWSEDGLVSNETYCYRLRAVHVGVASAWSNEACAWLQTCAVPQAKTAGAQVLGASSAVLRGSVVSTQCGATAWFEYGPTLEYGSFSNRISVGQGPGETRFSTQLDGLQNGSVYHFRAAAQNEAGTVYGEDMVLEIHVGTWVVGTLDDPAAGKTGDALSLREALALAEAAAGSDQQIVTFDQSLPAPRIVRLNGPLPPFQRGNVTLEGTMPGSNGGPGTILVTWADGANVNRENAFFSILSPGNVLADLTIGGSNGDGIRILGSRAVDNTVRGCRLGFDAESRLAPSALGLNNGIIVEQGASRNHIGMDSAPLGRKMLPGEGAPAGNLIANCRENGVWIRDDKTTGNVLNCNLIGSTDQSLAPGNGNGVSIAWSPANCVGGASEYAGNLIAGNVLNGVLVTGEAATGNRITRNCIYGNGMLGIDLSHLDGVGDGPEADLAQCKRRGPNHFMPAPAIERYGYREGDGAGLFTVWGKTLPFARVEAYQAERDPSGFGEGRLFLGNAEADATGAFAVTFPLAVGQAVTLLAEAEGDSSEFSSCFVMNAVSDDRSVDDIRNVENMLLFAVGVPRQCEILFGRSQEEGVTLKTSLTMNGEAPVTDTVTLKALRSLVAFPMTVPTAGTGWLDLELAGSGRETSQARLLVYADDAEAVEPGADLSLTRTLDGPTPFRLFKVSGQAGQILDVQVSSADASDPAVYPCLKIFGTRASYLNVNSRNDESTHAFAQVRLPESGDFFIAVSDLYLRQGSAMSFVLKAVLNDNPDPVEESFGVRDPLAMPGRPGRIAVGDLDGDGWPDMVSTLPSARALAVSYKIPGETAGFASPVQVNLDYEPSDVTLEDVDGNGRLDILVADAAGGGVHVLYNPGRVSEASGARLTRAGRFFRARAAGGDVGGGGDFNVDGFADYALLSSSGGTLQVFLNDKTGLLVAGQVISAGPSPRGMAVDDFDVDGAPDIAVAVAGDNEVPVFQGAGDGNFSLARTLTGCSTPVDVKSGDLNLDGLPDLLILNQGAAQFQGFLGVGSLEFSYQQAQSTGAVPNSMAVSDLNVDGYKDVSVACTGDGKIYVYMGSSSGLFLPQAVLTNSGDISSLVYYTTGNGATYFGVPPDDEFVSVLQSEYLVIDFPCAETGGAFDSAFALANPSAEDALVYLSLVGPDGKLVVDPTVSDPVAVTLKAHQQMSFYAQGFFGDGAANYAAWMRVSTQNQAVNGFTIQVLTGSTLAMDGAGGQTTASPRLFLPVPGALGAAAVGQYSVTNPGESATGVTVTCRKADGTVTGGTYSFTLAAGGRHSFAYASCFADAEDALSLEIVAGAPVECQYLTMVSDVMEAVLPGLPVDETATGTATLYLPHFAEGTIFRSTIELFNPAAAAAAVTVSACSDDGSPLGATASLSIPAGGALRSSIADLTGLDPASAAVIQGFLKVESSQAGLLGCVTFMDRAGAVMASSLPLQSKVGNRFLFSHLAVGTIGGIPYFTGIAVLNTGAADVTAHFTVYDMLGNKTGEADALIPAGRKVSRMLTDFVGGLPAQNGGYVTLTAPEGSSLMSFEIFGDDDLTFLSAVPAQTLAE